MPPDNQDITKKRAPIHHEPTERPSRPASRPQSSLKKPPAIRDELKDLRFMYRFFARTLASKKDSVRREIRERMMAELASRKEEIRNRIKSEKLSVREKREKYRREVRKEQKKLIAA